MAFYKPEQRKKHYEDKDQSIDLIPEKSIILKADKKLKLDFDFNNELSSIICKKIDKGKGKGRYNLLGRLFTLLIDDEYKNEANLLNEQIDKLLNKKIFEKHNLVHEILDLAIDHPKELPVFEHVIKDDESDDEIKSKKKGKYTCKSCGVSGHNKTTCPSVIERIIPRLKKRHKQNHNVFNVDDDITFKSLTKDVYDFYQNAVQHNGYAEVFDELNHSCYYTDEIHKTDFEWNEDNNGDRIIADEGQRRKSHKGCIFPSIFDICNGYSVILVCLNDIDRAAWQDKFKSVFQKWTNDKNLNLSEYLRTKKYSETVIERFQTLYYSGGSFKKKFIGSAKEREIIDAFQDTTDPRILICIKEKTQLEQIIPYFSDKTKLCSYFDEAEKIFVMGYATPDDATELSVEIMGGADVHKLSFEIYNKSVKSTFISATIARILFNFPSIKIRDCFITDLVEIDSGTTEGTKQYVGFLNITPEFIDPTQLFPDLVKEIEGGKIFERDFVRNGERVTHYLWNQILIKHGALNENLDMEEFAEDIVYERMPREIEKIKKTLKFKGSKEENRRNPIEISRSIIDAKPAVLVIQGSKMLLSHRWLFPEGIPISIGDVTSSFYDPSKRIHILKGLIVSDVLRHVYEEGLKNPDHKMTSIIIIQYHVANCGTTVGEFQYCLHNTLDYCFPSENIDADDLYQRIVRNAHSSGDDGINPRIKTTKKAWEEVVLERRAMQMCANAIKTEENKNAPVMRIVREIDFGVGGRPRNWMKQKKSSVPIKEEDIDPDLARIQKSINSGETGCVPMNIVDPQICKKRVKIEMDDNIRDKKRQRTEENGDYEHKTNTENKSVDESDNDNESDGETEYENEKNQKSELSEKEFQNYRLKLFPKWKDEQNKTAIAYFVSTVGVKKYHEDELREKCKEVGAKFTSTVGEKKKERQFNFSHLFYSKKESKKNGNGYGKIMIELDDGTFCLQPKLHNLWRNTFR